MKKAAFFAAIAMVLGSASAFAKKEVRVPVGSRCPAGYESAGPAYDRVDGKWVRTQLCREIHPMR